MSAEIRKEINTRLSIFTAYENKEAFDIIDIFLAEVALNSPESVDRVVTFWTDIIIKNRPIDIVLLRGIYEELQGKNYVLSDIEKGRESLDKYVISDWKTRHSKYNLKRRNHFDLNTPSNRLKGDSFGKSYLDNPVKIYHPKCLLSEEIEDADEPYYKSPQETHTKSIVNMNSHMLEGLEDAYVPYYDDED